MMMMTHLHMLFLFFFSTFMVISAFLITLQSQIIFALLFTFIIFLCGVSILFILTLEFIPLLILLIVVGAVLILFVFAMFITNQQSNRVNNLLENKFNRYIYLILCFKCIFFASSLKFTSFFQIWFSKYTHTEELLALKPLYDLSDQFSYAPILIILSFLLLILTVGISFLLNAKKCLAKTSLAISSSPKP